MQKSSGFYFFDFSTVSDATRCAESEYAHQIKKEKFLLVKNLKKRQKQQICKFPHFSEKLTGNFFQFFRDSLPLDRDDQLILKICLVTIKCLSLHLRTVIHIKNRQNTSSYEKCIKSISNAPRWFILISQRHHTQVVKVKYPFRSTRFSS